MINMCRPVGRPTRESLSASSLQHARGSLARTRRGSLLVEVAMAMALLMIAMALTVKVVGWVAHERRAAERRERAIAEVANLMERVTAYPFEQVTPELAARITLSEAARQSLKGAELTIDVAGQTASAAAQTAAKRIAIKLRWRDQSGEWVAPVRLTSWIETRRTAS
jgi:hypothetical protein